jgi:hypothetical protein
MPSCPAVLRQKEKKTKNIPWRCRRLWRITRLGHYKSPGPWILLVPPHPAGDIYTSKNRHLLAPMRIESCTDDVKRCGNAQWVVSSGGLCRNDSVFKFFYS